MTKKTTIDAVEEAQRLYEDCNMSAVAVAILTGLDLRTVTNLAAKHKWKAGRCDLCGGKYRRRTGVTVKEYCYELYFCGPTCHDLWFQRDR